MSDVSTKGEEESDDLVERLRGHREVRDRLEQISKRVIHFLAAEGVSIAQAQRVLEMTQRELEKQIGETDLSIITELRSE